MFGRNSRTLDSLDVALPGAGRAHAAYGLPPQVPPPSVSHDLMVTDVHWPERDVIVIEFEVPLDGSSCRWAMSKYASSPRTAPLARWAVRSCRS